MAKGLIEMNKKMLNFTLSTIHHVILWESRSGVTRIKQAIATMEAGGCQYNQPKFIPR